MTTKGTKRKIDIMKRDTKEQRAVACTKRRRTLFSKAADLCLFAGANMAVFVTSPSENSDVVYSFSGYSSASEIADCYLNNKLPPKINPQSTSGFWWEKPDLYNSCDDLSTLNVMEDRLERTMKDITACLEKKEKLQLVSNRDQNPTTASSQFVYDSFQNPSTSSFYGVASSQFVYDSLQNPSTSSSFGESTSQIVYDSFQNPSTDNLDHTATMTTEEMISLLVSFEDNPSSSFEEMYGKPSYEKEYEMRSTTEYLDQTQRKNFEEIYEELSSLLPSSEQNSSSSVEDIGSFTSLWETENENNRTSLLQETQMVTSVSDNNNNNEEDYLFQF